jgi:hypothetical protein
MQSGIDTRTLVVEARRALLNGSGKLEYFKRRGISKQFIQEAYVGFRNGAFTYPCIGRDGEFLAIHCKSKRRDANGKRRQWWAGYADDLPPKGYGRDPSKPAKVIPFGLESLTNVDSDSLVILCCGEEDALSLRQAGYTALSQPGAGLLEPVYAREMAGLGVVVLYDAGEEQEARRDAQKLLEAGAKSVRVAEWTPDAPNGADVNGKLVENPAGFSEWVAGMIKGAKPVSLVEDSETRRDGVPDVYLSSLEVAEPKWPELDDAAIYGLPGEIVGAMEPHTEADPVALLGSLLCAFGNAIGRGAHFRVGSDIHYLNLFCALVGESSKARKGMSWNFVEGLMRTVAEEWATERVASGLASGEGLIYHVRDRVERENKDGKLEVADEGVKDKRLLAYESELAGLLKVMSREGNTLSPVIRQAWDGGRLRTLTKNSPTKATDAHISMIGHVTRTELLRYLTQTEAGNGFANRFLWLLVKRSKLLPRGGEWHSVDKARLVRRLLSALEFGSKPVEITMTENAWLDWEEVYGPLSEGKAGMFGAVTGRSEAQVRRLAALHAVLDESDEIEPLHLEAALALWQYAEDSARYIFGDATGDPVADTIYEALKGAGANGMSRTDISNLFKRHMSAERIGRALAFLLETGRAERKLNRDTGGRPSEWWFAR